MLLFGYNKFMKYEEWHYILDKNNWNTDIKAFRLAYIAFKDSLIENK